MLRYDVVSGHGVNKCFPATNDWGNVSFIVYTDKKINQVWYSILTINHSRITHCFDLHSSSVIDWGKLEAQKQVYTEDGGWRAVGRFAANKTPKAFCPLRAPRGTKVIGFDGPGGTGDLFPTERVETISPQKMTVHYSWCSVLTVRTRH